MTNGDTPTLPRLTTTLARAVGDALTVGSGDARVVVRVVGVQGAKVMLEVEAAGEAVRKGEAGQAD